MMRLTQDVKQLESALFSDCPQACVGIRMKMRALYRAYGTSYPFCSYYLSEDGAAIGILFHETLFFSDSKRRSLSWEDGLSVLPVYTISSDTPLDMDGFTEKTGTFFWHKPVYPTCKGNTKMQENVCYGDIQAAYEILKEVFPETFMCGEESRIRDFYQNWYCEMSHRIRRGITDVAVLEYAATASIYCIEPDAVFFSQIGVLPQMRGTGLGKKLLSEVMQRYAGRSCYVFSKNPNADKFYTAIGFMPVGSWQDYIRKE